MSRATELPIELVEVRRRAIQVYGVMTLDTAALWSACTGCGVSWLLSMETNRADATAHATLAAFKETGRAFLQSMVERANPGNCRACGAPARYSGGAYHAYHSTLARDVVVRWWPKTGFFRRASVALALWAPSGETKPLRAMRAEDEQRFVVDASVRSAWAGIGVAVRARSRRSVSWR